MLHRSFAIRNRLLRNLPARTLATLLPELTYVHIKRRVVLQEAHMPVDKVYFIESGMAAVLASTQDDGPVEVGIVGRFGLIGVPALLNTARSPQRCRMEVDGAALQIDATNLRLAMADYPVLHQSLMNYVQALLVQNGQTALCNLRHGVMQRLARWLLLASDRLGANVIPLTHALLSLMLGVRRAGITDALSALEQAGAVRKIRGAVVIADRQALERYACECYRIIADEFAHLAGFDAANAFASSAPLRHAGEPDFAVATSRAGA